MSQQPTSEDGHTYTAAGGRILAAAEHCFGTLGYQKTSVIDIAAAAQVSKPLVYRYFQSKERLYSIVVAAVVDDWNHEMVVALFGESGSDSAEADAAESLRRMHRASLDFAMRSPLLRGILAQDSRLLLSEFSDVVQKVDSAWRSQIRRRLMMGVKAGEVRKDLPMAAIVSAIAELHLAYAEKEIAGRLSGRDRKAAEAGFECLLFGICNSDN